MDTQEYLQYKLDVAVNRQDILRRKRAKLTNGFHTPERDMVIMEMRGVAERVCVLRSLLAELEDV